MSTSFVKWRFAVGAAALLGSCTPYQVHTDYDREVSFARLRTFAWMDSTRSREEQSGNPFLERRVKRAVERAMADRGLTPTDSRQADVLVTAFVIGPSRQDRRMSPWMGMSCGPSVSVWIGSRYPFGFSRRGYPWFAGGPYWRNPWGYACAYRIGFGYGWLPLYDAPSTHLDGTLVIDVLDQESHELLWRGSAEAALLDARRNDQSQEEIDRIVREVLKRFPPED